MKNTKESRSLASEIIADLQGKLETAESQNTSDILRNLIERNNNQSDKISELSNIMEKLGHIAMNFPDRYELDSDKEKNERNACIFFAERENMYCDIRILCDYFCQAQGIVEDLESARQCDMNDMIETTMQTPIEIALGIDENGMTTAKKLFDFLGMAKNNYSRWFRNNLINNEFAEENIDYFPFFPNEENLNGRSSQERSEKYQPNPSLDARLTASFAKKLSMMAKSEKGEQARKYFVKVEDGMKELAVRFQNMSPELRAVLVVDQRVTKVEKKTDTLEARFNDFEQGLPLLPEDADNISKEVKKRVVELLGGKESNAYHNKSLCQKVFMDAYRNLKGNFDVSSYKAIKRNRKEITVQIAREYKPPLHLVEQIEEENSQIRFL